MQLVTASDTAVFMSANSSIVGSNCETNAATAILAKASFADLLINSNSLNLENYPLSGYVYPNKRIIKILGWNKD